VTLDVIVPGSTSTHDGSDGTPLLEFLERWGGSCVESKQSRADSGILEAIRAV
jgi:hypothetical protein